jgi:hypothetical protein
LPNGYEHVYKIFQKIYVASSYLPEDPMELMASESGLPIETCAGGVPYYQAIRTPFLAIS